MHGLVQASGESLARRVGYIILLELLTESVFFGRYRSVFLGIYHTDTEGKLGQYFRYQNFGGSPSKNWREPPFSYKGGASAPVLYTSPSF